MGNTYERLSWATAGIIIFIPENLLGVGILGKPFGVLLNTKYPNSGNYILSTHSAWVDFTLAFGIPALIFTLGALLITLIVSIVTKYTLKYLPLILSIATILIYTLEEIGSQHPIDIWYFWIALLATHLSPVVSKGLKNS